ncbi:hypothetical protein [Corynebacterium accolens]|nr:hypothetical protein [Corynebacterium accolens]
MLPDFTYCGAAAGNRQSRRALPRRRAAAPCRAAEPPRHSAATTA